MKAHVCAFVIIGVLMAASLSATEPVEEWIKRVETANRLVEVGDLEGAAALYGLALKEAESAGDRVREGVILQNLGGLLSRKGRLVDAEYSYRRSIAALESVDDLDGRLVARAAVGLSGVYVQTGQYTKARELIERMLGRSGPAADVERTSLISNLGVVMAHVRRTDEAEQLLRQAAGCCGGVADAAMQEACAIAASNLGRLLMREGRTAEAMERYRRALEVMEALPNRSPVAFASTLADYAKAMQEGGETSRAGEVYRRAIGIAERRLGENHVVLGRLLNGYAQVVREQGKKAEARKLTEAARRIQEEWDRENLIGHTVEFSSLARQR